jgi:hypothetical protein
VSEPWGPSLFQADTCLEPGVWMIDGFTVRRDDSGRRWFMYGPCDEFGMARTLADARRMIRSGEVPA